MVILCGVHHLFMILWRLEMKIDYKQWVINNQSKLNYTIISFYDENHKLLVNLKCDICGALKTLEAKSVYRNSKDKLNLHNEKCSSYYFSKQDEDMGIEHRKQFRAFYRYAKERCTNPNNKDYGRYKGKWNFTDYVDYYHSCWEEYKKSTKLYPNQKLSIDRIDGKKGYEKGNVRFIPLEENLRNKVYVKSVRLENIITGEIIIEPSLGKASVRLFGDTKHATAIMKAIKRNGIYLNTWKITYLD